MTAVILEQHPLTENEEMALYELSLANELSRGKRYRWRKDSEVIYQMVDDAFHSDSQDLIQKALNFFKLLPVEIQHQFIARRITPPSSEQIKAKTYRGATMPTENKAAASIETGHKSKKHVWRGVVTYED